MRIDSSASVQENTINLPDGYIKLEPFGESYPEALHQNDFLTRSGKYEERPDDGTLYWLAYYDRSVLSLRGSRWGFTYCQDLETAIRWQQNPSAFPNLNVNIA